MDAPLPQPKADGNVSDDFDPDAPIDSPVTANDGPPSPVETVGPAPVAPPEKPDANSEGQR
jgi:hypothetical protein